MSISSATLTSVVASRLASVLRRREIGVFVCSVMGLVATMLIGDGGGGNPLLAVAAPAAIGLLIRFGARLEPLDLLAVAAAQLAVGGVTAQPVGETSWDALCGALQVGCGVLVFQSIRACGLIRSPVSLMGALAAVAGVSALAPLSLDAARMSVEGAMAWDGLAVAAISDLVSTALVLAVVVTQGRATLPMTADGLYAEDKNPGVWEYATAASIAAALIWFSVDVGRAETAIAGSIALLWFALRLGLFPTTVAAFAIAVVHLLFGAADGGLAALANGDAVDAQMLRYLSVALIAAPSLVVATVIADQQRLKQMFAYKANHDGLTTLVNRTRFLETLDTSCREARLGRSRFLLLLIDLDYFKSVNDTYGHARGDRMLIAVAARLKLSMRSTDVVARLGGDEFAVLAPVPSVETAMRLARRVVDNVNQDVDLDGVVMRPSVTVGGVLAPDSAASPEQLMLLADEAMYKAKAAGRNCWRFAALDEPTAPSYALRNLADDDRALEIVFLD